MSDNPVREQIERDLDKAFDEEDIGRDGAYYAALDMATRQDQIAWNRCLDEVMKLATEQQYIEHDVEGYQALEKLKTDIEKLRR